MPSDHVFRTLGRGSFAALAAAAVLAGCGGDSKQDQAKDTVCKAKADIQAKVDDLKALPLTLASLPAAKTDVTAIIDDLQQIKDAQGDLSPDRKAAAQDAAQQFGETVQTTLSGLTSGLSASTAQAQIKQAGEQLATDFKQAFAPVDCDS